MVVSILGKLFHWYGHCKKSMKIRTPKRQSIAAVILKFEQGGFTIQKCVQKVQTE